MRDTYRRLRVVVVSGGLPADVGYLEAAAAAVDVTIFHSRWLPAGTASTAHLSEAVQRRTFEPVFRTRRGHLVFTFLGLARALDRARPDVVHVIGEPWALYSTQVARWKRRHPTVGFIGHGCDTIWHHGSPMEQHARRALLRYVLPSMDAYAAENSKALDLARAGGLPETSTRVRLHTNPRDGVTWRPPTRDQRSAARRALGLDDTTPAIGLIGRLVPQKGVRHFLDAADRLHDGGFPGRFFLAGAGPLEYEVAARSSDHLRFLGTLTYPGGVLELVRALDVIACPSLSTPSWEDQGPRVVLEAAMSGCVPVGAPTGGIPEMLEGHGVLSASTDVDDLVSAIGRAAELAARPGHRSVVADWARRTYSGEAIAARLVELWASTAAPETANTGSCT